MGIFQSLRLGVASLISGVFLAACGGGGDGGGGTSANGSSLNSLTTSATSNAPAAPSNAPAITSFSPTSVLPGGILTLNGSQLDRIKQVSLGGVNLPFVGTRTSTRVQVTVATGAVSGNLTVVDINNVSRIETQIITVLTPVVISAFAPSSALVGSSIVVRGSGLSRVTAVLFSGVSTPAAITARTSTSLTLTVPVGASSGPITLEFGVGETLISSTSFTLIPRIEANASTVYRVGAAGNPVTLVGRGFSEVSTLTVGGTSVPMTSRSDTQIVFSAPAGLACAAISLTSASQPTVAAGNLIVGAGCVNPLQISGIEFAQVQSQAANARYQRLNPGQETWVRAYVTATTLGRPVPIVRLRGFRGATDLGTVDMTGPNAIPQLAEGQAPPDNQRYDLNQSFRVQLPAAWVDIGLRVRVEVDPGNLLGSATSQEATPVVGSATRVTIVLVPLISGVNVPVMPTAAQVLDAIARAFPLARDQITVRTRAAYQLTSALDGVDTATEWDDVLDELDDLRIREDVTTLYYGLVRPINRRGASGIGYINPQNARSPNLTSVGWDASYADWAETMIHELGHNFSRDHAPCGGVAQWDAAYPYAGGAMPPIPLFDNIANTIVSPGVGATESDVMGYCGGTWFSDYNYSFVQGFLEAQRGLGNIGRMSTPEEVPLVIISGSIEGSSARIKRVTPSSGLPKQALESAYQIEISTASGQTMRAGVEAIKVDHASQPTYHFKSVLPEPGRISRIRILKNGQVIGERVAAPVKALLSNRTAAESAALASHRADGNSTVFSWNAAQYPFATIEHVQANGQRKVLALQASGGQIRLDTSQIPATGTFQIGLSDGLNVQMLTLKR